MEITCTPNPLAPCPLPPGAGVLEALDVVLAEMGVGLNLDEREGQLAWVFKAVDRAQGI
jgi:hypothetical protein